MVAAGAVAAITGGDAGFQGDNQGHESDCSTSRPGRGSPRGDNKEKIIYK